MLDKVEIEIIAGAILNDKPDGGLCDDEFVELSNVVVLEKAVVMDFADKLWVVFGGGLEDNLGVGELVDCKVDFAKTALAQLADDGVVSNSGGLRADNFAENAGVGIRQLKKVRYERLQGGEERTRAFAFCALVLLREPYILIKHERWDG